MNAPTGSPPRQPAPNAQLLLLSTFLQLEKEVRQADALTEIGFIAVNETHRLVSYDQAILWGFTRTGGVRIETVSAISEVDENAPFIRWLVRLIKSRQKDREHAMKPHLIAQADLPGELHSGWEEWAYGQALWAPFIHVRHGYLGGMLLFRRQPWKEAEQALVERIAEAYAHAWGALRGAYPAANKVLRRRVKIGIFLFLAIAMWLPVRESILVPAEVVASKPLVISPPIGGTIESIDVAPNQPVSEGEVLFSLNDTEERNRYLIAQETLAVARAELLSAEQKAFSDRRSKSELAFLRAKVKERAAEVTYLRELLERMVVHAPREGIAVFADPNEWIGKPVQVGEKIMTLADPERTEIHLDIPVADAITLAPGARTLLFLNTDPTRPYEAELYQAAYEAEPTPDNTLAFRAKARFADPEIALRIGLQGTGKIYGGTVKLYYYLFRRPWATLRQWSGM